MEISIQLEFESAHELQNQQPLSEATQEVLSVAQDVQSPLKPVHPNVNDTELSRMFTVTVDDASVAQQVCRLLSGCQAVEAAYLKPTDELP